MKTDVLTFLIFVSQVTFIFGKVNIMSNSLLDPMVKLICVSEDDGGALVWNFPNSLPDKQEKFHVLNRFNNMRYNEINCQMNANIECLESWAKQNWNLTNSLITPMGPVFDRRWEGDLNNTQSVIRKCVTGVPKLKLFKGEYSEEDSEDNYCNQVDWYKHIPLSKNEWRSFVITWNFDMSKIILYDTDKIILTYTEEKQLSSNNNYYMFIRSSEKMSFRLHSYKFLHTTVENATLTSPIFQIYDEVICVQLLIGLCVKCDAQIVLRDSTNNAVLAIAIVNGSTKAAVHGLPMWQSVTIKNNSINYSNYRVIIQLIPKLSNFNFNPLWAIANVRQCPPNETLRKSVITFRNYLQAATYGHRLNAICQKLFYNEHAAVSLISSIKSDVNLDASYCPLGKIGPKCLVSCEYDLYTNFDCRGTRICYEDGCMCDAGFLGQDCFDYCRSNTYGYNCKKTCGSCLYNETLSSNRCDTKTGNCHNGCNNTNTEFYIPPLCQTSVQKPNAPTIISTNETTIWANVSMTWKDEYEEISILYSFVIEVTYIFEILST